MILSGLRVDQDIIDEYDNELVEIVMEDSAHQFYNAFEILSLEYPWPSPSIDGNQIKGLSSTILEIQLTD